MKNQRGGNYLKKRQVALASPQIALLFRVNFVHFEGQWRLRRGTSQVSEREPSLKLRLN